MSRKRVLKVAVPCPLFGLFDYLLPEHLANHPVSPGMRVLVPFGRQKLTGIIIEQQVNSDVAQEKLRPILSLPDQAAVFPASILNMLMWAARYYMHPPGEVIQAALPVYLRQAGKPFEAIPGDEVWRLTDQQHNAEEQLKRAPRQAQLHRLLAAHPAGLTREQLNALTVNWAGAMKALIEKKLASCHRQAFSWQSDPAAGADSNARLQLNPDQCRVIEAISASAQLETPGAHLLFGVTGSGKTEVYLALSEQALQNNRQVLLLVPEISLTPQLTRRFQHHLKAPIAILHSGLSDTQRYAAWLAAAQGEARVIIGTRSSIFTPLPDLGLIIIDEEHDGSYKQQDSFRYNARDLAVIRGRRQGCPVVLGSATPSLESINNINEQRYQAHHLHQRANTRALPAVKLINLCSQRLHEGLSEPLLDKIGQHLEQQGQVLLFINRRGFAPLLMCHHCGWTTRCQRCDANMTFHKKHRQLHCHHCGSQRPAPEQCEDCGSTEIIAMGSGTERIENFLQSRFPQTRISRIDRDTTRNKGALAEKLNAAHSGESRILVGTQMLAKGHDFPDLTLVAVLDTDQALYSTDFRAAEHLAQLITQVAGRAGRAEKTGEVLIQTHHPDHPLLQTLLHQGYESFARSALAERQAAALPPSQHLVLLRSDSTGAGDGKHFLQEVAAQLQPHNDAGVEIFGPVPAPMERRAGRYRYQLMLQCPQRKPLHQLLLRVLPQLGKLKTARKVRWSIDVDPYDMF